MLADGPTRRLQQQGNDSLLWLFKNDYYFETYNLHLPPQSNLGRFRVHETYNNGTLLSTVTKNTAWGIIIAVHVALLLEGVRTTSTLVNNA